MGLKMTVECPHGVTFEAILKDRFAAWNTLAVIQELFTEKQCGCCSSTSIRWMTRSSVGRNNEVNTFYEIVCDECGAKLEFGVNKEGTRMWPKRRTKEKVAMPDRGWYIYVPPEQQAPPEAQSGPTDEQYNNQGYEAPPPQEGDIPF